MKKQLHFLIILTALLFSSCATIFTGTKDTINFNSTPEGAKVMIDGMEVCKTPCTTQVKRSLSDKLAQIKLDGYETRVITLDRKFNTVSIINLGSLLGWGIDAATGSLMKYDRKGYDIDLEEDTTAQIQNNPTQVVIDTKTKQVDVYITETSNVK